MKKHLIFTGGPQVDEVYATKLLAQVKTVVWAKISSDPSYQCDGGKHIVT